MRVLGIFCFAMLLVAPKLATTRMEKADTGKELHSHDEGNEISNDVSHGHVAKISTEATTDEPSKQEMQTPPSQTPHQDSEEKASAAPHKDVDESKLMAQERHEVSRGDVGLREQGKGYAFVLDKEGHHAAFKMAGKLKGNRGHFEMYSSCSSAAPLHPKMVLDILPRGSLRESMRPKIEHALPLARKHKTSHPLIQPVTEAPSTTASNSEADPVVESVPESSTEPQGNDESAMQSPEDKPADELPVSDVEDEQ